MTKPSKDYESKFRAWDRESWVRAGPHREAAFEDDRLFFSEALSLLHAHPLVKASDTRVRHELLVHQLYIYLRFTVWLELGPVNEVCDLLRREEFLPWLPSEMKSDAFKIYVEEAGHAEMSHALIEQVVAHTGVSSKSLPKPMFLDTLDRLVSSEEPEYHSMIKLFFVIISETLITGTLGKLPNDETVQRSVQGLVRDHGNDEKRHHAYFRSLFEYLWPRLPRTLRLKMGCVLPDMVVAFLSPDRRAMVSVLESYPAVFQTPSRIVEDLVGSQETMVGIATAAAPTLAMLKQNGVFAEPGIRHAFTMRGFRAS